MGGVNTSAGLSRISSRPTRPETVMTGYSSGL